MSVRRVAHLPVVFGLCAITLSGAMAQNPQADSAAWLKAQGLEAYARATPADLENAKALFLQSAALFRRAGMLRHESTIFYDIGIVYTDLKRTDSALVYYRRALDGQRSLGDRAGEAWTLYEIGHAYDRLASPDSALAYGKRSLALQRATGDRVGEARALTGIGLEYALYGGADSALAYLRPALAAVRASADSADSADELGVLQALGNAHQLLDRPDSALVYYRLFLNLSRRRDELAGVAHAAGFLGFTFRALGRPDSAAAYFRQALDLCAKLADSECEQAMRHALARR